MTQKGRDDVRRLIDDLMARLTRLRERYGQGEEEKAAPKPPARPKVPAAVAPPAAPSPAPIPPAGLPRPRRPSWAEFVRAYMGLFVVTLTLSTLVLGWFVLGIDETERAAAILLGVLGSVIGYYFGQRGTTRAQDLAEEATRRALETRTELLENFKAFAKDVQPNPAFLARILAAAQTDEELARKLRGLR